MKPRLLLTSNGIEAEEVKGTFLEGLRKSPAEATVAFITTAAWGKQRSVEWTETFLGGYKKQLVKVGIKTANIKEIDLKGMKRERLEKELEERDVIFVAPGDTFYLLLHARKSKFDEILPKLLKKGKLYVGVSAGSYIVGPNIEQAKWKGHLHTNWVKLKNLKGLGQVPFLLSAHFKDDLKETIQTGARTTKLPVVAISDGQAVWVEGNKRFVVGYGSYLLLNGFVEKV